MLTDIDEKTNLKRRLSIDDIYQISVHLDRRCQRRRPTCQIVTDDGRQVMTKTHMTFRPRELKNDIMLTVLNYLSMCAYIHIITTVITAKQPPFSAVIFQSINPISQRRFIIELLSKSQGFASWSFKLQGKSKGLIL